MGLIAKSKGDGANIDPLPEGVHLAVCYALIDLGTQYSERFDKTQQKVGIIWEIPGERIEIEKDGVKKNLPRVISRVYTNSLSDKSNLRRDLTHWRGRSFTEQELDGFDLRNIVGKACQLQIIHDKKGEQTYSNIGAVMALPKGMAAPEPENPTVCFTVDDLVEDDPNLPAEIPEWMQKIIKESKEWGSLFDKASPGRVTEAPPVPEDQMDSEDLDTPF